MVNRINQIQPNIEVQKKQKVQTQTNVVAQNAVVSNTATSKQPVNIAFNGIFSSLVSDSKFKTANEKRMFKDLQNALDPATKKSLDNLYKTGKLLDKSSNDKTSVLDNLHKVLTQPRIVGLDSKKILAEVIKTIENPFLINQEFGEIPRNMTDPLISLEQTNTVKKGLGLDQQLAPHIAKSAFDMDVNASGTCVAASIEFNLADKKPAEFARYVESLTGPQTSVKVNMDYTDIAPNFVDAVNLLNQFGVEYKTKDWRTLEVNLKPDRNAIIRARVQNTQYNPNTRSAVDVLMQSTFMQVGSENTYNTLTDKRYGPFNPNEKGLTEFEKNFTEALVDNEGGKTSVTYQIVDNNGRLTGYNIDYQQTKKHLLDSLSSGNNVIVGITEVDSTNKIIGGHEITVTGTRQAPNGELIFICNDTDDNYNGAVEISEKDFIPKIHHAGIPNKILNLPKQKDIGYQLLNELQSSKAQSKA